MSHQDRMIIEMVAHGRGVEPFSYEFVRGSNHLPDRCGRIVDGHTQSLGRRLAAVDLTAEQRARIYPGAFDLGNARELQAEACTFDALGLELEHQQPTDKRYHHPRDGIAAARLAREAAELLGHPPPQQGQAKVGPLLKVTKLLDEFRGRKGMLQINAILAPPTENTASLELTNPFALGAETPVRWNLVDLHGRVAAEISAERLARIDGTFGRLRDGLTEALGRIARVLTYEDQPTVSEVVQRYAIVAERWRLNHACPPRRVLPADEQLYVLLHALDFLHFVAVEDRLRRDRLLQPALRPVGGERLDFFVGHGELGATPVSAVMERLHLLLTEAVGVEINRRQFRNGLPGAQTVLNHYVGFGRDPRAEKVDALTALAALVVARVMRIEPAHYKPGLHGQAKGQIQSVKSAMHPDRPVSSTHEEFERIVYYAMRWARFALVGQTPVLEAQLEMEQRFLETAAAAVETYDTERVDTLLWNIREYADAGVYHVPQMAALGLLSVD